jgi:hypothetical protein
METFDALPLARIRFAFTACACWVFRAEVNAVGGHQ